LDHSIAAFHHTTLVAEKTASRLAYMPRGEPREHHERGARQNSVKAPDSYTIGDRQRQIGGWDNR